MVENTLKTLFSSPFSPEGWTEVLADLFGIRYATDGRLLERPRQVELRGTDDKGFFLGSFTTSDGYLVGLFRCEIAEGSVLRRRVGLRNLVRRYLNTDFDAALAVFTQKNSSAWRFSFICDLKGETTAPKRFTYVFGVPGIPLRTPTDRFTVLKASHEADAPVSMEAMRKAFSVEALSDEFFTIYKEKYEKFVSFITGKKYVKSGKRWREKSIGLPHPTLHGVFHHDDKLVRDYIKKMLGRLVFLHFLQKKGWLGARKDDWHGGDPAFLLHLFERATDEQQADFLEKVLERLFFNALNTDRTAQGNLFDTGVEGIGKCRIPYLNGGLFERDEADKLRVCFPGEFFRDLFDFFAGYNFTIDENDADEAEVGIDPEMLGRIFENLLEDNKDKGTFYTPKEIVRYMCRRSLSAYLTEGEKEKDAAAIAGFLETRDLKGLSKPLAARLSAKLREVKICDPAIGSGAFPMGLLRELFDLRSVLEPGRPELKRQIIENNIYGVDIERGAVDIARLRFWLALVVDADEPTPLPNLDFKIMQGNSLVESWKRHDLSKLTEQKWHGQLLLLENEADLHRKRLRDLLHRWFACSDHAERTTLRGQIRAVVEKQVRTEIPDFSFANSEFFLWHLWFAEVFEQGGFDIVIGNPPYIKEYGNRSAFDGFRETSKYYRGKMDLFHGFACQGIDLLKPQGLLCFIAQNNWTTNAGAKTMRNKVVSETRILELLDFNDWKVFHEAGIQTMIMLFRKNKEPPEYEFTLRFLSPAAKEDDYLSMLGEHPTPRVLEIRPKLLPNRFKDKLLTFSRDDELLDKIAKRKEFLSPAEGTNGIHTHHDCVSSKINQDYPNLPVGLGIFVLSSAELSALNLSQKERRLIKPYYDSKEIGRYFTCPRNQQWIIYTDSSFGNPTSMVHFPKLKKHLDYVGEAITSDNRPYGLHRAREEHFFKGEKIVSLRKCVGRPCFSYSDFDCYVPAMYYVIQTSRWDMKYLTGVLNSRLVTFWLRRRGKMQGKNFQVDKEPLMGIPLPPATASEQKKIAALVVRILAAKAANPGADTTKLEAQIDGLVYKLYDLTPEEVATVEGEIEPSNNTSRSESAPKRANV